MTQELPWQTKLHFMVQGMKAEEYLSQQLNRDIKIIAFSHASLQKKLSLWENLRMVPKVMLLCPFLLLSWILLIVPGWFYLGRIYKQEWGEAKKLGLINGTTIFLMFFVYIIRAHVTEGGDGIHTER